MVSRSTTYFEDGSYVVTVIAEESSNHSMAVSSVSQTKTAFKQAHFYNANNILQFSILVNGIFTYNGTTAKAINAQYGYNIREHNWAFVA